MGEPQRPKTTALHEVGTSTSPILAAKTAAAPERPRDHDHGSHRGHRPRLDRPPCPRSARRDCGNPGVRGPGHLRLAARRDFPTVALNSTEKAGHDGPAWLAGFLGPDFLNHVERAHLGPTNRNEVLKQVGQLDRVRLITFSTGIDLLKLASVGMNALPNTGLSRLQGVAELVTTDLSPEPIQGKSLKCALTQLEHSTYLMTRRDRCRPGKRRQVDGFVFGSHDPRITDAGLTSSRT